MEPTLFRHTLSEEEIASGTLKWTPADDETLHRLLLKQKASEAKAS